MDLICNPDTPCGAAIGIHVNASLHTGGLMRLRYMVQGEVTALRLPSVTASARRDALWKHTCFEAFLRPQPGDAYYEINLAPTTEWAAYRFDAYRSGMRAADGVALAHSDVQAHPNLFVLRAQLTWEEGTALTPFDLGLSAVIEEATGRKSYWALAHPPGKPDFHHADCFAAQIAAASAP